MAKVDLKITRHGNTIRVKAGSNLESIDVTHRSKDDIVDACRWIIVTGGVSASDATIAEMLRELRVIA